MLPGRRVSGGGTFASINLTRATLHRLILNDTCPGLLELLLHVPRGNC